MDPDQVLAASRVLAMALSELLNLANADQAGAQPDLEEIAEGLASALADVLQWMPERNDDDNQLHGAVVKWLP